MASKRMFDKEVITLDSFLDLPMEAKALYFLLGMEADDEGFINPKKVIRLYGGTEDSIKILILKGFIIPFESGVVVITDWKRNNWLDKRRIKETIYVDEKSQINYNEMTNKYEYLASAKQMLRENRLEQNSLVENSIVDDEIVKKCQEHIDNVRPIGADVTVITPTPLDITITGNVYIEEGHGLTDVILAFEDNLKKYLSSCTGNVIYTRVASCLGSIEGIKDYSELKVNGDIVNISYDDEILPIATSINLSEVV